jgi:hypothetical protein
MQASAIEVNGSKPPGSRTELGRSVDEDGAELTAAEAGK